MMRSEIYSLNSDNLNDNFWKSPRIQILLRNLSIKSYSNLMFNLNVLILFIKGDKTSNIVIKAGGTTSIVKHEFPLPKFIAVGW